MKTQLAKKKMFKVPHTYVILIGLVLLISLLSYIIPASTYDMVEKNGRNVVDPNTFHYVEQTPVSIMEFLTAVPRGLQEAAEISFFIFILGGSFHIINATGAMEVGVGNLAKKLRNHPTILIPVFVFFFSILGGTIGMSEETIVFVPIGLILARSLGFDAIIGMSIIFLGAAVGFNSGFMNPFTVGVAQRIAELQLFSGIWFRLLIWLTFNIATILYLIRYAKKIQQHPEKSFVYELEQAHKDHTMDLDNISTLSKVHKIVVAIFVVGLLFVVYGVFKLDFYITDIASIFLAIAILSGFVARISPSNMAKLFIEGAKDITTGALVVGIARSILVVLNDGQILYTIVHGISTVIQVLPRSISAVCMFIFQLFLNFFIPSGSGQAATTMPIMVPLSDIIGITRQTAVLAFHLGDGISNSIIPTGGSLLAALSVANIDYEDWVKFVWPIILIWSAIACVFCAIATFIQLGPA